MVAALNLKRRVSSKKSSTSSRLLGKEKVSSKVLIRRAARLKAKRTAFFSLPIDYIPCRQFLRLDAEKLASTPPVNGEGPHQIARPGKGEENSSTPYLSKLYRTFSTYATYAIQRNFFRLSHKGRQLRTRFVSDDESLRSVAVREPATKDLTPPQCAMLKATFSKFLGELEPREKEIIVARFGFHGMPARTFRELGIDMGVCKERIRQIQSRAMEKLREMALRDHLEQKVGDWI